MNGDLNYLEKELSDLLRSDPHVWDFIRAGSLDGVWYWDLENPDHEYMSPEFWRLFGFDPETKRHLASEWQDLIFEDDLELAKSNLERHLADPAHPYDQIVRYRHADGHTVWVRCRGLAIRDKDGRPTRLLGAHNDITQQQLERQNADTARAELETIFDSTTNGIIGLDEKGTIVRVNRRARHMLGGISDPTPFAWPDTIQFLDIETMQSLDNSADPIRRALSGAKIYNETHLMRRVQTGDTIRYVRISCSPVDYIKGAAQLVVVLDDVSFEERNRQAIERQSRLDALGQLTGGIAHDFNNLLASLLYAIDLAARAKSKSSRDAYFEIATGSVERGRELTSRMLSFARQQPGLATAKSTTEVFESFYQLVRPMIESNININFDIDDPDLMQFCDHVQLETTLMNLVLNARDAILRAGKGNRIDIRARGVRASQELPERDLEIETDFSGSSDPEASYRYVEISVSDDGPGMDEETLMRCTDPFFTTKKDNSGTGLGLAMAYGFARQSNGELRVYSELGIGTNVQLTLPRATSEGTREAAMAEEPVVKGNNERILIVEDEAMLLSMISEVVEDLGYVVLTARSGREALNKIKEGETIDLLLTDIVMPGGIGGFDLAREVRSIHPLLPVIYMSGYTGYTKAEMGAIPAPLLQKPTKRNVLAEAISNELSKAE
ncbi:MAG: PAS domain-containing protein [Pseudomonadota bacterium]